MSGLKYLINGKHMVDLIQILERDSLAFFFRYAAVAGQTRAQQHLLNWGRLSHLRKAAFQIIHIYMSNTNECLFIHPPPNQTLTKQQMWTAVYQITTQSVCLTHKRSNEKYLSTCNTFLLQWVYTFITFFLVALKGGIEGK